MKRIAIRGSVRRAVKIIFAAVMLAALAASFCGVRECAVAARLQIVPAVLGCGALAMVLFAVMAALWGRLYCEVVCPLGIVQDLLRWIARKKVRRVCSRLPETKRQVIVKWTVFVLFMAVGLAGLSFMWLDPYGIFGRGVALTGGVFFVVLALALVGRGRFWCNWICPVGTLLQAVSRFSVFKDRFDKCDHCEECRKCIGK
ncbi:MAG: 4Fe-4S binding protein [Lentisphaerae bacterium]|nr:4Fe-4S binding protein [Lentisphaerota bacterium]